MVGSIPVVPMASLHPKYTSFLSKVFFVVLSYTRVLPPTQIFTITDRTWAEFLAHLGALLLFSTQCESRRFLLAYATTFIVRVPTCPRFSRSFSR